VNLGVPGETIVTALANYATEVRPYCVTATAAAPVYLHLAEGTNDIGGGASAATVFAALQAYWAAATADGCTVIAATLTPTGQAYVAYLGAHNTVNSDIRAAIGQYKYLDDLASLFPNPNNLVWYNSDTIHYTAATDAKIADFINGILSGKNGFQPLETSAISALTAPSLSSSWTALGSTYAVPGYWTSDNGTVVHIQGLLTGNSGSAVLVFTMPASLTPTTTHIFPLAGNNGALAFCVGQVLNTGEVNVLNYSTCGTAWISLDAMVYSIAN
jgi:hypothetical protein